MANEPKKVRQRRSMLQIPGVQTILSSLLCIVLGLLVGFVVLLLIDHGVSEKTGNLNARRRRRGDPHRGQKLPDL